MIAEEIALHRESSWSEAMNETYFNVSDPTRAGSAFKMTQRNALACLLGINARNIVKV